MLRTPLTFTAEQANSTIRMVKSGSAPTVYLEASPTGEEGSWSDFIVGETIITLADVEDKVYFRAKQDNTRFTINYSDYNYFVMTGKIAASGNLNTLLKADGSVLDLSGRDFCYSRMFQGCTSLTKAPALPATTLPNSCYLSMFSGCTSLTKAPAILATTANSGYYGYMFENCSSLTNASFPNLTRETVANEVVTHWRAFYNAANNIETTCLDGILVINSTAA